MYEEVRHFSEHDFRARCDVGDGVFFRTPVRIAASEVRSDVEETKI